MAEVLLAVTCTNCQLDPPVALNMAVEQLGAAANMDPVILTVQAPVEPLDTDEIQDGYWVTTADPDDPQVTRAL